MSQYFVKTFWHDWPLQVGGSWQPTPDGRSLIGRMVLKKLGHRDARTGQMDFSSEATLLGLKVSEDKMIILYRISSNTFSFPDCRGSFHQQRGDLRRHHREGEAGERGGPRGSPSARGPGPRVERGQPGRPESRRGQGHHRRLEAGALHWAPRVQGGRGVSKVGDGRPWHGPLLLRWQIPLRKDIIRMMMIVMIIVWRDNCITVPLVADARCSLH